jgi:hypothetical protein
MITARHEASRTAAAAASAVAAGAHRVRRAGKSVANASAALPGATRAALMSMCIGYPQTATRGPNNLRKPPHNVRPVAPAMAHVWLRFG